MAHVPQCLKEEGSEESCIWKACCSPLVLAPEYVVEDEVGQVNPSYGEDLPQGENHKGRKLIEIPDLWKNVGGKYECQSSEIAGFHG